MAVVGASGAVGLEIQKLLKKEDLILFDSKSSISFKGIDLAFFCLGAKNAKDLIPTARAEDVICIDASSAYRDDPDVPLIVPEINAHLLKRRPGIIASPNCTTTLMLLPLAPLHKKYRMKRIVVSTYQAVSGAGKKGITELKEQTKASLAGKPLAPECFPYPCAFNVFPHESAEEEERKMDVETKKILGDENVCVTARCIRVPVFRVHSQAINVEFFEPFELPQVLQLLSDAPGIEVKENPTPLDASGKNLVFCGNVRLDKTQKNTLELWVVGDQLLKGAALNMVQIAQCLK
ncbi:MAG: aspartate-semialdehyde dehydrogenase [Simkaniaceae bacterium]|nr:aspartate-semialdehyde dehydrogenase [Candidatus Sacchlamyda saccharinae]